MTTTQTAGRTVTVVHVPAKGRRPATTVVAGVYGMNRRSFTDSKLAANYAIFLANR